MRKTFAVLVMGCALFATAWVLDANPVKDERNVGRTTTHLDGLSGDHLLETLSSDCTDPPRRSRRITAGCT
ncbi:MAG: hypothetical protein O3A46_01280 [Candidatus Poribacteria bacterium]|nr:hypothetical protein [Candidatus Poribacteria bacterium]